MTFTDPQQLPMTGLGRRFNPTTDLTKRVFENEDMALYDLFMATLRQGRAIIEGITFKGCRIEGPAVMLVLDGTSFEATNFGNSKGNMGNMVLRPAANIAIGTIPVRNCTFDGCEFFGLGFTGEEAIVEQILAIRSVS